MTKDEALKLALDALETSMYPQQKQLQAITAIKESLANEALEKMAENARELGLDYEPAQEPVAWLHRFIEGGISIGLKPADLERHPERWEPLYTSPPQRKPLTDEEIEQIGLSNYIKVVRETEAKLKE